MPQDEQNLTGSGNRPTTETAEADVTSSTPEEKLQTEAKDGMLDEGQYKLPDGKTMTKAEVDKILADVDGYRKGFQREYTKKRMAETQEIRDLRMELEKHKGTADDALLLQEHLRTSNPKLYQEFVNAMAAAKGTRPQASPAGEPGIMPRNQLPVRVQEMALRMELDDFSKDNGVEISPEQRHAIFEKMDELEKGLGLYDLGIELPVDVAARYVLFDLQKAKLGQSGATPRAVKPALKGSTGGGSGGTRSAPADERAELLALLRGE